MSSKPVFVATHPRSCSTAFERVFMTRRDTIQCVHEPFGDAYYYGPERLAKRYDQDERSRAESGFSESTYKTIMDRINRENTEGKRILIKDMAQYFIPPDEKPVSIAPSLLSNKRGIGTADITVNGRCGSYFASQAQVDNVDGNPDVDRPYPTVAEISNPTVVPSALLQQFHFAFLIRHPRNSIPSYYRCCIPPLEDLTGFHGYRTDEAGYTELRRLFDYLIQLGCIGPEIEGKDLPVGEKTNAIHQGNHGLNAKILVMDADDLLDNPTRIIEAFCESVGISFNPEMLVWDSEEDHEHAAAAFEKWKGFHDDAINSRDLKPRNQKTVKTDQEYYNGWVEKYGKDAAGIIQKSVDDNLEDYEYLKSFAIRV